MKALSKKREMRYQSCQELLADLATARQMHPLSSRRTIAASPAAVRDAANAAEVTPIAASVTPSSTTDRRPPSTDDTVDSLPVGVFNSDDTVAIGPQTWAKRVTFRIDSAVSGAFGRLRRPGAPGPTRQTGMRKR
jgi:hypothetical protein